MQHQYTFCTLQLQKKDVILNGFKMTCFALSPQAGVCSFGGPLELAHFGTCRQHGLGVTLDRRVFERTSIFPFALRPEPADGL